MKLKLLFIFLLSIAFLYSQEMPVINEVMPNLPGVSAGRRWIEIYNPSMYPYHLLGWQLQTAGTAFSPVFIFPDITIQPDEYIVVGENQVTFANFTVANLNLQAGMNNTVGARLVSRYGNYIDTVLWSSPNNNNLADDTSDPAIEFAPRPPEGRSLSRNPNGYDSNKISDWSLAENPTPGSANFVFYDLAIIDLSVSKKGNIDVLHIVIHDLSTNNVDNDLINLQVNFNDSIIFDTKPNIIFINKIADFALEIVLVENAMNSFIAEISYPQDVNISNNIKSLGFWHGFKPLIINELQFQPLTSEPEWIEFFNRTEEILTIENAFVRDAAGAMAYFSASIEAFDYLIITQNSDLFEDAHPLADMRKVIQTSNWAVLNNSAETVELFFTETVKIDSVSYVGVSSMRGRSLERINPWNDENVLWAYNMTEIGSSPLAKNSQTPADMDAKIDNVNIYLSEEALEHKIQIRNLGLANFFAVDLILYFKTETMENYEYLQETSFYMLNEQTEIFYSPVPVVKGYHFFMYKLIFGNEQDIFYKTYLNETPPVVINEIMFQPFTGEPIWVEFIKLRDFIPLNGLKFFARTDSIHLPHWEGEFALLTTNAANALFMRDNYDIPDNIPIFTGLRTLLNAGQELLLKDYDENVYEGFAYTPAFSPRRGFSAERISPLLPPDAQNWTSSLEGSTPGKRNSVYMNLLPSSSSLVIENNPFSPFRGEHCLIQIRVAEQMVRADLKIFDIKGREILKLADKTVIPGDYSFIWNGMENYRPVSPGVYPLYINIEDMTGKRLMQSRKLIYVGY